MRWWENVTIWFFELTGMEMFHNLGWLIAMSARQNVRLLLGQWDFFAWSIICNTWCKNLGYNLPQRAWWAATPDYEIRHARSPRSNFHPQARARANETLREFQYNGWEVTYQSLIPSLHTSRMAVQSNKVYLPHMSSSPYPSFVARQINAIC
jgi:hypothetical protein